MFIASTVNNKHSYLVYSNGSLSGKMNLSSQANFTAAYTGGNAVSLGDINNDGFLDLISGQDDKNSNNGSVYIYSGASLNGSKMQTTAEVTIKGRNAEHFGYDVAVGDYNKDGKTDLLIGAYAADTNGNTDAGAAYLFYGPILNGTYLSSASNLTFNGAAASDQAGMSVALSDLNNDGFADVIVSAPAADPNGNDVAGEVYISYAKVTCTIINSNITLNQNVNANGNCFTVNASNIIVDGNGYNVTGNGSGIGINLTGFNNVIVKNVVLQNFSMGLYEAGGANNTLMQSSLLSNVLNDTQIEANGGYNTTLLNVTLNRAKIGVGSAGILNLKWYVNIYVNDTAGNALDGVTVWGYNLTNGSEQNATTTSGNAQLALAELYQNGSTVTYITNHTVNVTKNLYTSSPTFSNLNLSITNSTRVTFILSLGCGIINADVNFSAATLYKNGSCFNVTASNLIIDGKGLIVRGNGTGAGISLSNANNITFSNINIYNFSEGLSVSGSNNSNFLNSIFFNSSNKDILVAANGGANITFTNVTFGRNNVSVGENGSITSRWLVKASATSGASALANVNISVINISGTIVASNTTNSAGEAGMILTEFLQDNTSRYYYTPHNFTATKSGYANSTQQLNLTATNSTTLSSNLLRTFSSCGHNLNESMTFQAVTLNLSTNITCFNVTADNVVIDGNGTMLLGNNLGYTGFEFTGTNGGSNITLRNFGIRNFQAGVIISNPTDDLPDNITLINFNISDSTVYGIVLANVADININDSYIINSSLYDIHLSFQYPDQVNYLTNVTFNKNSITPLQDVNLQLKWYADVQVNDTSGNPINNVNVSAYKADGTLEETKNTSANGKARLTLTEFSHTTYGYSYATPHSIVAFKPGYLNNLTSVDISATNNTRINLGLSMPSCGSTLSRNFTFGANVVSNDTCFTMGANNLAVNGYGYNLTGNGSGTGLSISSYRGLSVSNLQVNNFSTGVNFYLTNDTSLRNVNITGAAYGIIFNNSNNNTLYDSFLSNNSVNILAVNNGGTVNSLVNTSVDINSINVSGTATVYVKWYVDVNVTYSGSYPLANANVTARFNSTGAVDYSAITNSNGIARLEVSELKKNASGVFYLTPSNITVFFNSTLSGYSGNSTIINISSTNNTKVSLGLNLSCTAPYDDLLLTANTVLCPGTFEIYDGGSIGVVRMNTAYNLTCDNTVIKGTGSGTGIAISGGDDFTISGCTVRDYEWGIRPGTCPDNALITNFNATSVSVGIQFGGFCNNVTLRNFYLSLDSSGHGLNQISGTDTGILLENGVIYGGDAGLDFTQSNSYWINSTINNVTFIGTGTNIYDNTYGLYKFKGENNTIKNSNFSGLKYGIYFNATNTIIFNNTFESSGASHVYNYLTADVNSFNLTVNGTNYGNSWEEFCNLSISDTNGDGYGDSGANYPYNSTQSSKFNSSGNDYAPKILTCPSTTASGATSTSSSTTISGSSAPAAPAAPAVAPPAAPSASSGSSAYTPGEVRKYLQAGKVQTLRTSEQRFQVLISLENTGDKTMQLTPEIHSETDDPFFIVTRKTLGTENSLFSSISSLAYSKESIAGRLLNAKLVNPEQITLQPGEKVEKLLEVQEGFGVPRQMKIVFSTLGENVKEQEVKIDKKFVSAAAVDIDTEKNTLDIYALIAPEERLGMTNSNGDNSLLTGAAVVDLKKNLNSYWIELNILFNDSGNLQPWFTELYGPYPLKEEQGLVFGQQLKYDPEVYGGNYVVETTIYHADEKIAQNTLPIELDGKS